MNEPIVFAGFFLFFFSLYLDDRTLFFRHSKSSVRNRHVGNNVKISTRYLEHPKLYFWPPFLFTLAKTMPLVIFDSFLFVYF